MPTFLLTGGRAPATLDLARLLHAAGHRVVVAESLDAHLCTHSRAVAANHRVPPPAQDPAGFAAALARIAAAEGADWIVPTCEEVFWVARGGGYPCPVLAPPLETLRRLHDKGAFIDRVRAAGLAAPATWRVGSDDDLAAVRRAHPGKLVLKPAFSRFATRVRVLETWMPAPRLEPGAGWVAQAFVEGQAVSTWGVAHGGRLAAHAAYPARFTAGGPAGGPGGGPGGACIDFRPDPDPALEAWVARMVAAEGYTGLVGFDLIRDVHGRLWPLECNPRATSGIHLFQAGDGLDRALRGTAAGVVRPRPEARAMLGLAMAVYGLPQALGAGRLPAWAEAIATARDVVWAPEDPWPVLGQVASYAGFLADAALRGIPVMAATTRDIEWNGQ